MKRPLSPCQVMLLSALALIIAIALVLGASFALNEWGVTDPKDPYPLSWILGIAVGVVAVVASLAQVSGYSVKDLVAWIQGGDDANPDHLPGSTLFERDRQVMLEQVREFWVKGVFEHSLYRSALLSLGMEHRPELVTQPWNLVVKSSGAEGSFVSLRAMTILELFEQSQGALLILGEAGSGKTTTLLDLTRSLLAQADRNKGYPMPVVFSLSSWSALRSPLDKWLVEELYIQYQVPRRVGEAWVSHDLILPLLDGFDEVKAQDRIACAEAINAFRSDHGPGAQMVVCSRTGDYESLSVRLRLRSAIALQPLTLPQIDAYLEPLGTSLALLRQLIREQGDVRELATNLLMLSVMIEAFRDAPQVPKTSATNNELFSSLFEWYVQRMLERPTMIRVYVGSESRSPNRGGRIQYSPNQARHWLSWMAAQLLQRNRTIFRLRELQNDWLPRRAEQRLAKGIGVVFASLLGGLVGGLLGALAASSNLGFVVGSVVGFVMGLAGNLRELTLEDAVRPNVTNFILVALSQAPFALAGGLVRRLKKIWLSPYTGWLQWVSSVLVAGMLLSGAGLSVMLGSALTIAAGVLVIANLMVTLCRPYLFHLQTILQHGVVQLLLWRNDFTPRPWKHALFLDDCTERVLLHKVGSGYVFAHRLLLEWFAQQLKSA